MADWQDRLKETFDFTSPSGLVFQAKWKGNDVTVSNPASISPVPDVIGDKVQTQKPGSELMPITVYFGGPNNDIDSRNFVKTLIAESTEKWTLDHPVDGPLKLIWINDATRTVDPTSSGNLSTVTMTWIESVEDSKTESAAQLQKKVDTQAEQANEKAAAQFTEVAPIQAPVEKQSLIDSISNAITKIKTGLSAIENFQIIDPQILAIAASIQVTLDTAPEFIDTDNLAGQMQQNIQLFGLGATDANSGIAMYSAFNDDVLTNLPTQATNEGLATIAGTELVASATIVAAAQASIIGGLDTRADVLTAVQALDTILLNATNALDITQGLFAENPIDTIYFSQSSAYADMLIMIQTAQEFLYLSLLGLPAERTTRLEKETFTAQIAKDEYGTVVTADNPLGNLDKLIATNQWHGDGIYLQEAGVDVLIYQS